MPLPRCQSPQAEPTEYFANIQFVKVRRRWDQGAALDLKAAAVAQADLGGLRQSTLRHPSSGRAQRFSSNVQVIRTGNLHSIVKGFALRAAGNLEAVTSSIESTRTVTVIIHQIHQCDGRAPHLQ
jgi:hypothetical protein